MSEWQARELRAEGLPAEQDFWSRVSAEGEGCWEWAGHRTRRDYGRVEFRGRELRAHRVAYALANGQHIPHGLVVMHSCDNPPCCNPAHLSLGTPGDNNRDRHAKGRTYSGPQQTECKKGHPFTPENTLWRPNGHRRCRPCSNQYRRDRHRLRRALVGGAT